MSRSPQGFHRLGDLLGSTGGPSTPPERLASVWAATVGEEVARHAEPLYLQDGRLVVATSSSVWAQSLDLMGEQLRGALNEALGGDVVREMRFRPAGWDPGGAHDGPRPLSTSTGFGRRDRGGDTSPAVSDSAGTDEATAALRTLTPAEEAEIARVRASAPTPELGERIAAAMRASWAHLPRPVADVGEAER